MPSRLLAVAIVAARQDESHEHDVASLEYQTNQSCLNDSSAWRRQRWPRGFPSCASGKVKGEEP
jgi:hypothetical protein